MYFQYSYNTPAASGVYTSVLVAVILFLAVIAAAIAAYVLKGLGMYAMARQRGIRNPWLAFVPYARTWFQGELCGEIRLKNKKIKSPGVWLLVLPIAAGIVSLLIGARIASLAYVIGTYDYSYAGGEVGLISVTMRLLVWYFLLLLFLVISGIIRQALQAVINYQIYGRYTTKNLSVVHAVFSTMVPLYEAICMFVMRERPFYREETPAFEAEEPQTREFVPEMERPAVYIDETGRQQEIMRGLAGEAEVPEAEE